MAELDDTLKQALTLGRAYYTQKNYAQAERYLAQVVEQNPTFADVYNMLGVIYHDQGQYQRAQRAFETALLINPGYTDAALNLAIVYNDTGQYQAALDVYRQAMSHAGAAPGQLDRFVKGKLANMYADIGDVWLSSGKYAEAVADYERALALCPGFVDIRARLAAAHRDAGQRERAIAEYEEAVRQNPSFVPARLSLGLVLQAAGRRDEAVSQWNAVLAISPGNRNAEMYLKLAGAPVPGDEPAAPGAASATDLPAQRRGATTSA
jgi:tetratricopeptide (TPR) repeat protein